MGESKQNRITKGFGGEGNHIILPIFYLVSSTKNSIMNLISTKFLDTDSDYTTSPIDSAKKGDLEYFKNLVNINSLQNFRDEDGNSVLAVAAQYDHLECCQEILRRCPSLMYHQSDDDGSTLLQIVLDYCSREKVVKMLELFLNAEEGIKRSDEILQSNNLLTMANNDGHTVLHVAVARNIAAAVRLLIQADTEKKLLMMVDKNENTALHLAVQNSVSEELSELLVDSYHSYDIGSNKNGETPFLIAVRQCVEQNIDDSAAYTAGNFLRLMLSKEPHLAKASRGARGWTALHHAAFRDNIDAVSLLLGHCPDCSEVVDHIGRNFLHIAAENGCVGVVKHALSLGSEKLPYAVLNQQDKNKNTPLHIAALKENQSLTECLLYDNRVSKTTINVYGQEVLAAIKFDYDRLRAGVFSMEEMNQKRMKEQGEFDLVVSALIAAVTFTAGITIPGGYFSDGPSQGMAVLSNRASFFAFVISNNFALMFSLYAVFSHFCVRRLLTMEDTIYQLNVATRCTFAAIFAMMVAFITGSYIVLANSKVLSITACVQCCCFFIFAANAMRKMVPSHAKFWKKNKEPPTTSKGLETV